MTTFRSCAFVGNVVHKRLMPRRHAFTYRVFALCLDVDELDRLSGSLRLFSHNRWNLLSFHDADHAAGTGEPVGAHAREVLRSSGLGAFGARIELVCYPRLLGYVFNPLSVYFGYDVHDRLGAIIYEVSNTLKERKSYVIPVASSPEDGVVAQACDKAMYVSPFTASEAGYSFRVVPPADQILVGVDLREQGQAVLKTYFKGSRLALSDKALAGLLLRYPLMTFKVIAAIHIEALRLWMKGVPLKPYHASPRYSFTKIDTVAGKIQNV